MVTKDPAFLFYTSDFLTGTMTMTDEQVGKYIRLLCLQHQRGYLTEKDMLFICGTYVEDIFCKFKFEDGKYYNERLRHESEKRLKYSESRKNNRNSHKTEKDVSDICSTYVGHMENENENIIVDNKYLSNGENPKEPNAGYMDRFRQANVTGIRPKLEDVLDYAQTIGITQDVARDFYLHYDAQDWTTGGIGARPIGNWVSKLEQWSRNQDKFSNSGKSAPRKSVKERLAEESKWK